MISIRLIFFLATRSIMRYARRTLQTFLILFLGTLCIMLIDGFMKGYAAQAGERIVAMSGHIDIHATGYLDAAGAMPLDRAVENAAAVMDRALFQASSTVSSGVVPIAAPAVVSACMLSNGEVSRAAEILATTPLARVMDGNAEMVNPLLAEVEKSLVSGRFFNDPLEAGLIVDRKHAEKLKVEAGDTIILLGNDAFGSFSMLELPVVGIVREASLPGEAGCVVDYDSFSEAFGLSGAATSISLWFATPDGFVSSTAESGAADSVREAFRNDPGIHVRKFSEIAAGYAAMFAFLDIFLAGMMAVFALVACVGITNAILLSVQDRLKDLGTLRAIALTSRQAGFLIYTETLLTGCAAAVLAFILGALTLKTLGATGITFRLDISEIGRALPSTISPGFFPVRLTVIAALSLVFPLLAAVLPARKARKLTIRESLGK